MNKQYLSLNQLVKDGAEDAAELIDNDGKIYLPLKYKKDGQYIIVMVEIRKARFE